jgi:hypothetical protein
MATYRYRLIDTFGSEIGIITIDRNDLRLGSVVNLPEGGEGTVVDVYDDEYGQEGGVVATLAVEETA